MPRSLESFLGAFLGANQSDCEKKKKKKNVRYEALLFARFGYGEDA